MLPRAQAFLNHLVALNSLHHYFCGALVMTDHDESVFSQKRSFLFATLINSSTLLKANLKQLPCLNFV